MKSSDYYGQVTNEAETVGIESKTIEREFDAFGRLTGNDGSYYGYASDGRIASISNEIAIVEYLYTTDRIDAGYTLSLSNGLVFARSLTRDEYRRSLVTSVTNSASGLAVEGLAYSYDALNRPTNRNDDAFLYNDRNEVVVADISGREVGFSYDGAGNLNGMTSAQDCYYMELNSCSQYTSVGHALAYNDPEEYYPIAYDLDGDMTLFRDWTYSYDAANRLKTVSSNAVTLVTNFYDAKSRRVKKVTAEATTTFFYDGWNLVEERVAYTNGTTSTSHYYWGKDLSGTLQGAGGVGGLLYLTVDGSIYIPCYDNNGNVTRYLDANGNAVAQYTYDAFGKLIAKSGQLADFFRYRFSTKYFDSETGLYYYGYRFYHPVLMRWLNRDPIGEDGGLNLYAVCGNNVIMNVDKNGCAYFAYRPLDSFFFRWFVAGNHQDEIDNTMIAHEQLFFEDNGIPSNLGYFDDNQVRMDSSSVTYRVPHSRGWNDCIMRKAVMMVKPQPFKVLNSYSQPKYNCQDWADDVRYAYYCLVHRIPYYSRGKTFIGKGISR